MKLDDLIKMTPGQAAGFETWEKNGHYISLSILLPKEENVPTPGGDTLSGGYEAVGRQLQRRGWRKS